jgi:hypothetical protein
MLTPAPAPLRRTRFRHLRHPLLQAEKPAPPPALPDDTQNLKPQAVAGALFRPPRPARPAEKADERTAVTLPPARSPGRGAHLAAPEREFLALFVIALGLAGAALFVGRETLAAADLLLAGTVLLSGLGMLVLGYASRARQPRQPAGRD